MKTETTPKQAAIDAMARIRRGLKSGPEANPLVLVGFRTCAIEFLRYIESTTPESEQWTNGCTEAELNEQSTVGDHLGVTRKALGLLP